MQSIAGFIKKPAIIFLIKDKKFFSYLVVIQIDLQGCPR